MNDQEFKKFVEQIGSRILELRNERKMSQSQFCALCNLDKREIQRLEKAQTSPTIKTLYKITSALEIDFLEFFDFLNNKEV